MLAENVVRIGMKLDRPIMKGPRKAERCKSEDGKDATMFRIVVFKQIKICLINNNTLICNWIVGRWLLV